MADKGIPSKVSILKHPLHPIIVAFPISFLTAALLTDIGYWQSGDFFWARMSVWLIGGGFVTGLIAAIMGAIDFFTIARARNNAGWIHFIVNVVGLSLAGLNWLFRVGDDPSEYVLYLGLILSLLTAGLLGAGGFFGGELTFRYKIGVFGDEE